MSEISEQALAQIHRFVKRLREPWLQMLLLELASRDCSNAHILVGSYLRDLRINASWPWATNRSAHFSSEDWSEKELITQYPAIGALSELMSSLRRGKEDMTFIAPEAVYDVAKQTRLNADTLRQLSRAWEKLQTAKSQ